MLIYPQLLEGHFEPGDRKRKRHVSKKMGASPVEGAQMLSSDRCVWGLRELIGATTIARILYSFCDCFLIAPQAD